MGSWRAWHRHRERQLCPAGFLVQQPHGFVFHMGWVTERVFGCKQGAQKVFKGLFHL